VEVGLLGPLEVRDDAGTVLDVGGARLRALLGLLALRAGRVVPAGWLIDALWGGRAPAGAANALQAQVSRLRRAAPGLLVAAHDGGYRLVVDRDQVDVHRFERLAAAGHARLRDDPTAAATLLRSALALWRGPALADLATLVTVHGGADGPDGPAGNRPGTGAVGLGAAAADLVSATVARLAERRLAATEDRADAELRLGVTPSLVAELEGLVAAHPLREPLVAALMRALCAVGRRAAALTAYDRLRAGLADDLGVSPTPALTALHTQILRTDTDPPAGTGPPAARRPATNLRAQLTSFVGREPDLTTVLDLVLAHRLVTLTGTGGAGKTRLAVEVATRLTATAGQLVEGVWVVELAAVDEGAGVVPAVLAALGVRERALLAGARPGQPVEPPVEQFQRVLGALAGRRAVLVVDNCEHLVGTAAQLVDGILAACPGVRVLATSREPLGITGEVLWPVEPLAVPPAGVGDEPAALVGYPAVRLLVDRVRAVRPGFAVDAGSAAAVARVCRALDGIPLAIELAAARFRALAPKQVARHDPGVRGLRRGGHLGQDPAHLRPLHAGPPDPAGPAGPLHRRGRPPHRRQPHRRPQRGRTPRRPVPPPRAGGPLHRTSRPADRRVGRQPVAARARRPVLNRASATTPRPRARTSHHTACSAVVNAVRPRATDEPMTAPEMATPRVVPVWRPTETSEAATPAIERGMPATAVLVIGGLTVARKTPKSR
jgi:DNA-binding SARP family transcriptional activator